MSDDLSSAEGVPPSPKAEGLGPALVSGAAPLRTLDIDLAIEKAIEIERERCARIAEETHTRNGIWMSNQSWDDACDRIAAAIRSGK